MSEKKKLPEVGIVKFITPVAYMPLGKPDKHKDVLVAVSLKDLMEAQKKHEEALHLERLKVLGEVREKVKEKKKKYWHIQFEGISDPEEKARRIHFNEEVTVLLNSVLDDLLTSLEGEKE